MKTLKLALVAIFIASTTICLAGGDEFTSKPNPVVYISLTSAVTIPGLATAIHEQVDPGILTKNQLIITVSVYFGDRLYLITGTNTQWRLFFYPAWSVSGEKKTSFSTKD